jgi:hypothetical protein
MQSRSIPLSPWIRSAHLSDLLALVLGTITSTWLVTWQQQVIAHTNSGFGGTALFLLPLVLFSYSLGILFSSFWLRFIRRLTLGSKSNQQHYRALTTLQIWAWTLLIGLLLYVIWELLPVPGAVSDVSEIVVHP